ncbi:hsp70 nucleotide exchange factor fes1 [Saitoella coloradoensis]
MSSREAQLKKLLELTSSLAANNDAASAPAEPVAPRQGSDLNAGILDQILGPDEAELMKEAMTVIMHPQATLENKEIAFDNLEMLIENLDNANNLKNLGLWPPLLSNLSSPEPSLRLAACGVIGTAVQNNEKSQNSCLEHDGLTKVIDVLQNDDDNGVRVKAVYAVSSIIRNNSQALKTFGDSNGWKALAGALDGSTSMTRKAVFLISALLLQDEGSEIVLEQVKSLRLADKAVSLVEKNADDEDMVEKLLMLVKVALEKDSSALDTASKEKLRSLVPGLKQKFGTGFFTEGEWKDFEKLIA